MHWTALIARRHLAPNVRVVDDLACTGCGYNLRALLASGACPECGLPVIESMYRLKQPDATAAALRTIGRSFMAPAVLLLVPLAGASLGVRWLILGGLAAGCGWRVIGAAELRFRCAIERLPVLGFRANLLLLAAIADGLLAVATLVLFYLALAATPPSPALEAAFGWTAAGWVGMQVIDAVIAGRFGAALAGLLDWTFIAREFARQVLCVLLAAGCLGVFALAAAAVQAFGGSPTASAVLVRIGAAGMVLLGAAAVGFTVFGFLHLAGAAERDRDAREEVLAAPEEDATAPRQEARSSDLPEIPLEGE